MSKIQELYTAGAVIASGAKQSSATLMPEGHVILKTNNSYGINVCIGLLRPARNDGHTIYSPRSPS